MNVVLDKKKANIKHEQKKVCSFSSAIFIVWKQEGKTHSAVLWLYQIILFEQPSDKQHILKLGFSYGLNLPENKKTEWHCRLVIFIFSIINRCVEGPFFIYPLPRNQINVIYISKTGQIYFQNSFSCRSRME